MKEPAVAAEEFCARRQLVRVKEKYIENKQAIAKGLLTKSELGGKLPRVKTNGFGRSRLRLPRPLALHSAAA